jgi:putative colanic acid biosynthesis UDP-glucose lipid carrier transferase
LWFFDRLDGVSLSLRISEVVMDATSQETFSRKIGALHDSSSSTHFPPAGTAPDYSRSSDGVSASLVDTGAGGHGAFSPYLLSRRKRALDIAGSLTILTILSPLLAMIAVVIRLTSPGPALFRQIRTGVGGRPFEVYKFRSMYVDDVSSDDVVQASRADARITPFGRFIRRTSLDELPQIINVLQGTMSLVGPRPHAVQHDEYYSPRIATYDYRFAALPGVSGLAQVSGARGGTPRLRDMERRITYDLAYVRSASLIVDLRIIGATLREMLFSASAY